MGDDSIANGAAVARLHHHGIADFNNPPVAKLYLTQFDTVWNASEPEQGLRVARRG